MKLSILMLVSLMLSVGIALAQSSGSFQVSESEFNHGGRPEQGSIATSFSFRITLDTLGASFATASLSGSSRSVSHGWASTYGPPSEVEDVQFVASDTLDWIGEATAYDYQLYRDTLSNLSGLGYGECVQTGITSSTTTDTELPAAGNGFFYLVTAQNRLGEKGAKGKQSNGSTRGGAVCP